MRCTAVYLHGEGSTRVKVGPSNPFASQSIELAVLRFVELSFYGDCSGSSRYWWLYCLWLARSAHALVPRASFCRLLSGQNLMKYPVFDSSRLLHSRSRSHANCQPLPSPSLHSYSRWSLNPLHMFGSGFQDSSAGPSLRIYPVQLSRTLSFRRGQRQVVENRRQSLVSAAYPGLRS